MRVPQTPDFELSERSGGVPVWANDMLLGMYGPGQDKITVYGPKTNGTYWVEFRTAMAEHIAQCLNLEHEIHHTASKLCILGFDPLK
jgi:hypothetical protein